MERFDSWPDLLAHIRAGGSVRYHAPLDVRPVSVLATVRGRTDRAKVRVIPCSRDADPFWADAGHLDRFRCDGPRRRGGAHPIHAIPRYVVAVRGGNGSISFGSVDLAWAQITTLVAHHPTIPVDLLYGEACGRCRGDGSQRGNACRACGGTGEIAPEARISTWTATSTGAIVECYHPRIPFGPEHLVPCPGAAHDNPWIDHCGICAPGWGWITPARAGWSGGALDRSDPALVDE